MHVVTQLWGCAMWMRVSPSRGTCVCGLGASVQGHLLLALAPLGWMPMLVRPESPDWLVQTLTGFRCDCSVHTHVVWVGHISQWHVLAIGASQVADWQRSAHASCSRTSSNGLHVVCRTQFRDACVMQSRGARVMHACTCPVCGPVAECKLACRAGLRTGAGLRCS